MISLVTTVLNDRQGCEAFFAQMEAQTQLPDEIVVVDGGSRDGTWELLQSYQPQKNYSLRVFQEIGCNVARGRNIAIAQAHYEVIVSTDVGCTWQPQWLEELVQPLLSDPQLEAVMGSWQVRWEDLQGEWAKVEYAFLDGPKLIADTRSHASSRAIAYRKSLWHKIGGYPEDLTLAGDDMVFALLLHRISDRVVGAPIPRCHWERPTQLKAFCKEARRNFRGGGEAGIWLKYGCLVGGRLLLEPLLLLAGVVGLVFGLLGWAIALCWGGSLLSAGFRFHRLRPAMRRLRGYGDTSAWFRILKFEYLIKFWSVVGYWEGWLTGGRRCQNCRARLRQANQADPARRSLSPKETSVMLPTEGQ